MSRSLFFSIDELPEVFHDLTPIPQEEPHNAAARIDYPEEFKIAYDYQRAVWNANETNSERALKLTAVCLRLNPANYTVWHFRRLCLQKIYTGDENWSFLKDEMYLTAMLGGENPKNYQIWYHRRALLERLSSECNVSVIKVYEQYFQDELEYISSVFDEDGKNYHAWSQRQWVISTMSKLGMGDDVWKKEIEYSDSLIQNDIRNNSAWNQRWFCVHEGQHHKQLSEEIGKIEADYALSKAELDPYNESPWTYFTAVLKEQVLNSINDKDKMMTLLSFYYDKTKSLEQHFFTDRVEPGGNCSPNLTSALIDILEWKGDPKSIEEACSLAYDLANKYDVIRYKYWTLRILKLQKKKEMN